MPFHSDTGSSMSVQNPVYFRVFPIVTVDLSSFISRKQKLTIVTEIDCTSITSTKMTGKSFCSNSSKVSTLILVDDDLVVRRLSCEKLSSGMHRCSSYCMHLWLRYVSCHDRNSVLPNKQFLIIWRTHELVLFNESKSIYWAQVLIVLHSFCASFKIKLKNFLGTASTKIDIWVVFWRVEFYRKRYSLQLIRWNYCIK